MCKKWAYFIASVFINQLSCLITKYIFLFVKLWDTHILDCKIVQYKMSNVYCLMHYKLIINKWSIDAFASLFRSHWLLIAMLIEIYLNTRNIYATYIHIHILSKLIITIIVFQLRYYSEKFPDYSIYFCF